MKKSQNLHIDRTVEIILIFLGNKTSNIKKSCPKRKVRNKLGFGFHSFHSQHSFHHTNSASRIFVSTESSYGC